MTRLLCRLSVLVALLPLAACDLIATVFGGAEPIVDPATGAVVPPVVEPPALLGGVDVLEVVILALATLGLAPVARILTLSKPLITPILRAIIGRKSAPVPPAGEPKP